MFTFPHANGLEISDQEFLAGWFVWVDRFGAGLNPATDVMPRRNVAQGLAAQLSAGHRFSLDVLCRMLVGPSYRNGMQATRPLLDANTDLLEHAVALGVHGAPINGVRLTDYAREILARRVGISQHADEVEARIEADVELDVEGMEQMLAAALAELYEVLTTEAPRGVIATRADLVERLVDWIDADIYQPRYRGRSFGVSLCGWDQRLGHYFWPTPATGLQANQSLLAPLLATAARLSATAGQWTGAEREQAVVFAEAVFKWGGVPQRPFTADTVESVFCSALKGARQNGAPMNSGWTKVAAFATAHLEDEAEKEPLIIWDSRVAHSLIRRNGCLAGR